MMTQLEREDVVNILVATAIMGDALVPGLTRKQRREMRVLHKRLKGEWRDHCAQVHAKADAEAKVRVALAG